MIALLSSCLLALGLGVSPDRDAAPPHQWLAQASGPTKAPPPPTEQLKKVEQPPSGIQVTTPGSRMIPLKPTIQPRGPANLIDRTNINPNAAAAPGQPGQPGQPPAPPPNVTTPPGPPSHRLKGDEAIKPGGPAAEGKGTAEKKGEKGSLVKDQDRKCQPLPPHVKVRMNFNDAEVLEIVQWISEQTCKNFIISDTIRGGKITILSNTPVTAEEAYRAFLAALNANNMTVVEVGKFFKLQMKRDAPKDTVPTYIGDKVDMASLDLMVTRLLQLKFADANTVNGTVKQLVTKDGDSYPYAPTNTLIITDTASNMHRLMRILEQLDTPLGQEEIRVVQIKYAAAADVAKTLDEIFGEKAHGAAAPGGGPQPHRIQPVHQPAVPGKENVPPGGTGGEGGTEAAEAVTVTKVLADERTNKLIVVAAARSFLQVQDLIDKIDVPIPGEGQIQVVYLENAKAEDLAATLTALAQGTANRPKAASPSPGGAKPAGAAGPKSAAELFQGEVKITADKSTNSLVIMANQTDFKSVLKVIKQLDIPRRQVFVEAVIMEVNMDNSRDTALAFHGGAAAELGGQTIPLLFGTQYKVNGQNFNSINVLTSLSMLGFISGLRGPNLTGSENILGSISLPKFGVMLEALQTDSNVNVLSTPHIITSDNEEAEIKVGENIPIPAGYGGYGSGLSSLSGLASMASQTSTTSTTGLSGLSGLGGVSSLLGMGMGAINRQEVGLTMKVKPQINKGNVVRMELDIELTEVADTSNPLGPTTTKRSAKTVVLPRDQETVVVGGLIREKLDIGETKVPVLGDIPVIGWFFRQKTTKKSKTNLLLFLTPYVVEGPEDFRAIFERKMRERKEFLEQYYNVGPNYRAFVDFRKKHGPLADIHMTFALEMTRVENGGTGTGGEIVVTPEGAMRPGVKALLSGQGQQAPGSPAGPAKPAGEQKPEAVKPSGEQKPEEAKPAEEKKPAGPEEPEESKPTEETDKENRLEVH